MQFNRLSDSDISLIDNKLVGYDFGYNNDVAELHIYDSANKSLQHIQNYTRYKPNPNYGLNDKYIQSIDIYPETDLKDIGYTEGSYKLIYNFLRKISNKDFFLKSISSDRTEIIVTSNSLQNDEIETVFNKLKSNFEDYNFIKNYLINFDNNDIYLITNIALDKNSDIYNIFLKLYTPLDSNISIKLLSTFCEEIIQTNEFDVTLIIEPTIAVKPRLKSANFDIDLDSKSSISTEFLDTTALTSNIGINSPIQSLLKNSSIKLNVNYEDFSEFSHYGNVEQRILNFVYKIKQIELYLLQKNSNLSNTILLDEKISKVVTSFDDYEYFLYTSGGTKSYPKNNDGSLKATSSSNVITWLGDSSKDMNNSGILGDAKYYDTFNKDSLINNIPEYLIIDERNRPFTIFCNMIGQHFDSIWIVTNKFTNLYESNNNLSKGISPEIVENVLKSFGVKLYNSMSNVDITNLSHRNYNKEIYKRIYHNLPFLKKYKGTRNGLTQLINIFGIPDTLYRIYEYGSIKKVENFGERIDNVFNYALTSNRNGYIDVPFKDINTNDCPQSILFRLKLNSKRTGNVISVGDFNSLDFNPLDFTPQTSITDYSENLFKIKLDTGDYITAIIETFDNNNSSIYLTTSTGHASNRMSLNLYNKNWSTIYLNRIYDNAFDSTKYKLTIGQIINGKICKKSVVLEIINELSAINNHTMSIRLGQSLNYSIQKLLIFDDTLYDETFDSHIFNPTSIQDNGSYITTLSAFRSQNLISYSIINNANVYRNMITTGVFSTGIIPSNIVSYSIGEIVKVIKTFSNTIKCYIPFGTDLKTYNHNSVTSLTSKLNTDSYNSIITLTNFENVNNYVTNYDTIQYNSPNTLSTKRLTNKISIPNKQYYGNVLSTFKQIEQPSDEFVDYKFLDVVFSPTFEQDDDIINTIGYFNLDDYIGDPNDYNKSNYIDLKTLKKIYLTKLVDKYSVKDYINMVNYIDNSLFKMIQDFVPISSNTSSGILIRQNILNRNKIKGIVTSFEQFLIDDIVFSKFLLEGLPQNVEKDFDIYLKKDFDKKNRNKFLKTLNKSQQEEFKVSLFNENINFFNNSFEYYSTIDSKNRYGGIKVISKNLNEYSTSDTSLGKTFNVTSYVDKIGLFTNISKNDIFDKKSNIQLKYLVDKNGGLTDLNKLNKNFYDVQGLFKKDDFTIVNLFDNIKYSNQKSLDGDKKIFTSAYSYNPVLYFSNKDKYFKFDNIEDSVPTYFRYIENKSRDITNIKTVYDLFGTKDIDINSGFVVGDITKSTYSTYTIPESGQYEFNLDVLLNVRSTNTGLSFQYNLTTYRNFIRTDTIIDSISYLHQPADIQYDNDGNQITFPELKPVYKLLEIPIIGTESMKNFNWYWSYEKNSYNLSGIVIPYDTNRVWKLFEKGINKLSETYQIYISDDDDKYKTAQLFEVFDKNGNLEKLQDIYFDLYEETIPLTIPFSEATFAISRGGTNLSSIFIEQRGRGVILKDKLTVANGINNSYNKNEKIICVLQQVYINDTTPNTIMLQNSSSIYSIKNNFNLKIGATESLITNLSIHGISISSKLNDYIGKGIFNMSGSNLYSKYGDINGTFNLQIGDVIFLKDGKTSSNYYLEISTIKTVGQNLVLGFLNELPSFVLKENLTDCIFISKIPDETNIVINFNKKIGETSYGFLIPKNISPYFMDNIDIITKEVKQKLLNDYSLNKNSI